MIDALARDGIAYVPFFPLGGLRRCNPPRFPMLLQALMRHHAGGAGVAVTAFTEYFADSWTSSVGHLRENMASDELVLTETCWQRWTVLRKRRVK